MTAASGRDAPGRGVPAIELAAAAILAFVILIQGIGAPFQRDAEPQSAEWIVSIVRDGQWLAPRDYYGFMIRKPPLYYWLSALVTEASGGNVDETRARIVPVLSGTVVAIEVLAWTALELGPAEGWLAFLFLLGMYGFSSRATLALTDMLMTAILMSAYLMVYTMLSGQVSAARIVALGSLLGLGVICKGPMVLVLLALAVTIFLLMTRGSGLMVLRRGWPWMAAAIALAIGACWYVPWLMSERRNAMIFLHENFGHFAPAAFGGTGEASRPVWYIVARIVGGANPLILLLPAAVFGFVTGEIPESWRKPLIFQSAMVIAIVTFFSVASAKRDDYILPALPGIAILCAAAFGLREPSRGYASGAKIRDGVTWLIGIGALVAVAVAFAIARTTQDSSSGSSDAQLIMVFEHGFANREAPFIAFAAAAALAGAGAIFALLRRATTLAGVAIGIVSISGVVLTDAVVRPRFAWARSYKSFVAQTRPQVDAHELFVVDEADYELAFYHGKAVPPLVYRKGTPSVFSQLRPVPSNDATSYLIARDRELVLVPDSYRQRLRLVAKSSLLGKEGPPALYAIEPLQNGLNTGAGTAR